MYQTTLVCGIMVLWARNLGSSALSSAQGLREPSVGQLGGGRSQLSFRCCPTPQAFPSDPLYPMGWFLLSLQYFSTMVLALTMNIIVLPVSSAWFNVRVEALCLFLKNTEFFERFEKIIAFSVCTRVFLFKLQFCNFMISPHWKLRC